MQLATNENPSIEGQPVKQGSCLKGRYVLLRTLPLAESGFLYLGRDQRTGESLRIRAVPTGNLTESIRVQMRNSARKLMAIRRPDFFPRVRDLVETDGVQFLVQEGIQGITLWDFLNEESPSLPDRYRITHIFRQIADRLTYLHNHIQGTILFRDLTPERVLIDPGTRLVRLVDFELPGLITGLPQGKPDKGTRQFLAPELYKGMEFSILTDVYALGRVLQFLVFGDTEEDPNPATPIPTAVGRGVPDTLRELVQRMIAPDPSLRPDTVQAAKEAFEGCLEPSSARFSLNFSSRSRNQCQACNGEVQPEYIFCPGCGHPIAQATTSNTSKEIDENSIARIHVTGLDKERFQGLKPISLERFSLMKMSAQVARLGGYENLVEHHKDSTPGDPLPLIETLQVLRDLRGRALLVGEDPMRLQHIAGTLLAEYRHRNWANRALILAPGNLAQSWKQNLFTRNGLEAEIFGVKGSTDPKILENRPTLISSAESLFGQTERKAVLSTSWDLVIVDAAHLCTSRGSHRWQLLEGLKSKYLLLLTPTPVQDDSGDLLSLLRLVRPDLWNISPQDFRAAIDNTLPAIRDKLERSMVVVKKPENLPEIQTTYYLAEPEDEVVELYKVILNSLTSNDFAPNTITLIMKALTHASPMLLKTAAEDEAVAALVAGVQTLLEGDRHPKIHHLVSSIAPAIQNRALVVAVDPELRRHLADFLSRAGMPAISANDGEKGTHAQTWQRFEDDQDIRFLILGDDHSCPWPQIAVETVIFFDLPWEPAQIASRISRLCVSSTGGHEVKVIQLLSNGTVEEWLYDLYQGYLQVYRPGSPMLYAFQAAMSEEESIEELIQEVAAVGIQGCHGSSRALNIQERITGIRDHVENTKRLSDDILRLFSQEVTQ